MELSLGGEGEGLDKAHEELVLLTVLGLFNTGDITILALGLLGDDFLSVRFHVGLGVDNHTVQEDLGHSHSVLGESTGLIGADA